MKVDECGCKWMKWVKVDEMDFKDFIIAVNMIIIFIHFGPLVLHLELCLREKVSAVYR